MEIIIALAIVGLLAYAWYVNQSSKPKTPVDLVQPNPVADVAEKNIKETTEAVLAKVEVEVAPAPVETPVAETTPEPVKEQPWINNNPAPIAKPKRQKQQPAKATTAPKKKKPAPK
jgi:hypothetical protein